MENTKRVPLNTTIRGDLKKKLAFDALNQGRDMNDILEEVLENYYEAKEEKGEK